jgi:hypothetical protein
MKKSRIRDPGFGVNISDHILWSLVKIFELKIPKFSVADQDPGTGSENPPPGSGVNIRIRNSG